MKLCVSCEVQTESRFHFVVVTLCDSCEVQTGFLNIIYTNFTILRVKEPNVDG
jgi:hypothetical protein